MSVFFYDGNVTEVGEVVVGSTRRWLKSTAMNKGPDYQIWIEAWDGNGRTQIRCTPDEAFRFALDIMKDVSLAKYGSG